MVSYSKKDKYSMFQGLEKKGFNIHGCHYKDRKNPKYDTF